MNINVTQYLNPKDKQIFSKSIDQINKIPDIKVLKQTGTETNKMYREC